MKFKNPHAMYVNCDGALDYGSKGFGGVGFQIQFPESLGIENVAVSIGRYAGANIERMELEALFQAMEKVSQIFIEEGDRLQSIKQIIFITDRFALSDAERSNPFLIQDWRSRGWKNFEGKPIKNHESIDKLDKARKKLSKISRARINIEYRRRKHNKVADKLAKTGKSEGTVRTWLAKKLEKIGKRKFDGQEVAYKLFKSKDQLHVHVFRKEPVQAEWEVWVEICEGEKKGQKLKIYTDNQLAEKLQRGNEYIIRLKNVHRFHVEIYRTIKKRPKM